MHNYTHMARYARRRQEPFLRESLRAFREAHHPRQAIVVCREREERVVQGIRIVPWRSFLEQLWGGEIMA